MIGAKLTQPCVYWSDVEHTATYNSRYDFAQRVVVESASARVPQVRQGRNAVWPAKYHVVCGIRSGRENSRKPLFLPSGTRLACDTGQICHIELCVRAEGVPRDLHSPQSIRIDVDATNESW